MRRRMAALALTLALASTLLPTAAAAQEPQVTWLPQYDFITRMYGTDRMLVNQDGRYGMADLTGREIVPCEYAVIRELDSDGTAAALKGGKWGRIDKNGNVVTPFQYTDESTMAWGVTVDEKDGLYGVVDNAGNVVAPYIYYAAGEYVLGVCDVRAALWINAGYIDTQGNPVGEMTYITSQSFDPLSGLGIVSTGGTYNYGAVNTKGEVVIPCQYAHMWQAGEGIIGLADGYKVAFADNTGALITGFDYVYTADPKGFQEGMVFQSGLALVRDLDSSLYGYINAAGEEVIPCRYDYAWDFEDGLALVREGESQYYIDTDGNRAPSGYPYHEGLRRYESEKKWGFADGSGAVVIAPQYDAVGDFDGGVASVRLDGVHGLLASPLTGGETGGQEEDAPSGWASGEIARAQELGLVVEQASSGWQEDITRAQFAALAVNLVEKATGEALEPLAADRFTDTQDVAARKAAAAGIVNGTGDGSTFSPNASITRQELAAMLYRAWEKIYTEKHGAPAPEKADLSAYTDAHKVSDWAAQPVSALARLGIMEGTSATTLSPLANTTVEQGVLLVLRAYETL